MRLRPEFVGHLARPCSARRQNWVQKFTSGMMGTTIHSSRFCLKLVHTGTTMTPSPQFAGSSAGLCSAKLENWERRFMELEIKSSLCTTHANRARARVVVTELLSSGSASDTLHCLTRPTRESPSQCPVCFGPFSRVIRVWLKLWQLWLQRS